MTLDEQVKHAIDTEMRRLLTQKRTGKPYVYHSRWYGCAAWAWQGVIGQPIVRASIRELTAAVGRCE